ncbi:MAG: hypothetical protein MOGMAGMI_00963 [Candidatus Omnitrophica bacterium]|nr:hypothetical protein [Candidatus Omnitrophota bacterium]
MRRLPVFLVLLAALAGLAVWWSLTVKPGKRAAATSGVYSVYRGTSPALRLTFEYPADWSLREETGRIERYAQVLIEGPRNASGTLNPMLVVRSSPRANAGGRHPDARSLMEDHLSHLYKDPRILINRPVQLSGRKGYETEYTHTIPPLHKPGLKGRSIDLRTRHLFIENGEHLVEVQFFADRGDFDVYRRDVDRLLTSLKFSAD